METPQRSSRHRKRDSDPLAELPDNVVEFGVSSPSQTPSDSLISWIILGPLTMLSFLLSLCVVDSQQRAWRLAQHQHNVSPWWKRLSPWTWWNAEPYQSPHDSTWQHAAQATTSSYGPHGNVPAPAVDTERWYTRKKHRKMAKLAISDALELKGKVAFTLVAAGLLGLVAFIWFVRHICSTLA